MGAVLQKREPIRDHLVLSFEYDNTRHLPANVEVFVGRINQALHIERHKLGPSRLDDARVESHGDHETSRWLSGPCHTSFRTTFVTRL